MGSTQDTLARLKAIGAREDEISAAVTEVAREQGETTAAVKALRDALANGAADQATIDEAIEAADAILAKQDDTIAALAKVVVDLDATQTDPGGAPVTPITP